MKHALSFLPPDEYAFVYRRALAADRLEVERVASDFGYQERTVAVEAGRDAYLAGRMATRKYADPSSPLAGLI